VTQRDACTDRTLTSVDKCELCGKDGTTKPASMGCMLPMGTNSITTSSLHGAKGISLSIPEVSGETVNEFGPFVGGRDIR
jgi:hypothetical protein